MKQVLANLNSEQARLNLDALMQRGEEWALEIGQLLRVIQEKQFYHDWGFKSLKSYLESTYGISRSRGYQLIEYAKVMESLPEKVSTMVDTFETAEVVTERHARVLSDVPEKDRAKVLADAAESPDGVTIESLQTSLRNVSPLKQVNEPPRPRDHTGWALPESVLPLWHRQQAVKDMLKSLGSLRGTIRRVMEAGNDSLFRECDVHAMLTHCDNLHAQLKLAVPYAVCPYCHGITLKECQSCKGRGVMSQFRWDHTVPEEMKQMRKLALDDERKTDK